MAVNIPINPQGGSVSWSILVSHLTLGVYRTYLYGSDQDRWGNQKTTTFVVTPNIGIKSTLGF